MASRLHHVTMMRKFGIDAGHRVLGHEGKCKNLHGHRYRFDVFFYAIELDSIGRIMDFNNVKQSIGGWLDEHWDHGMILNEEDPLIEWFKKAEVYGGGQEEIESPFFGQKYYGFPGNPTAENLASYLLTKANYIMDTLGTGVKVVKVRCHETPNCSATAIL